jgi:hypothetical protein
MKKNPRKIQNYLRNTHGKLDFIENVRGWGLKAMKNMKSK